jgi:hypothetical protein
MSIKKVKMKKVKFRFYTFGRWNAFLYSTWILSSPFAFPSLKNGLVRGQTLTEMGFSIPILSSSFFALVKKIVRTLFVYCMESSRDSKRMTPPLPQDNKEGSRLHTL